MENRPDPLNRFKLAAKKAVVEERKNYLEEKSIPVPANGLCMKKQRVQKAEKPPNRYLAQFKRVWSAMRRFYR